MNEQEKYLACYDLNFQKYYRTVLTFQLFNILKYIIINILLLIYYY